MPLLPAAAIGGAGLGFDDTQPLTKASGSFFAGQTTHASSSSARFPPGGETTRRRQTATESLVRDRYAQFQILAKEKGNLPEPGFGTSSSSFSSEKECPSKSFMKEFFQDVNAIQGVLTASKANIKTIGEVLEDSLMATTRDKQKAASDRLQLLVEQINQQIASVKQGLETLKLKSEVQDSKQSRGSDSAEAKIRKNMQIALGKKHQQVLSDFQKAQTEYKKSLQKTQAREMEILMPDATVEERERMCEGGETAAVVVAKKMAGAHAVLLDEIQNIRDKHLDILKLEKSIADLAQMFQEMAVLVDSQGEMLDSIEANVHKTKSYTAKAEKELITAKKAQHKHKKCMCWLAVIMTILALIILGPVLLSR